VKHLYYPLYLAILAAIVLFHRAGRTRRLSPPLLVAGSIVWGAGTFAFMLLISEPKLWFQDFRQGYWLAGRMALTCPAEMYGCRELNFVNLPLLSLLFVPFAALGEITAGLVFEGISLAVAAAAWRQLCQVAGLTGRMRWVLAGLFVVNGPLVYSLGEGNATTFVLPVLASALAALSAGRSFRCGVLLGVAGLIKPPLLLLPAYYTLRRHVGIAAGSAVVVLTVIGLSLLFFGVDVHRVWYERCVAPYLGRPVAAFNAQSVASALARFWAPGDYGENWSPVAVGPAFHVLNKALLLALAGGVLLVCLRRSRDAARAERLDFCLVLGLALLISPICWTHYFSLLLLPLALVLGGRLGQPTRGQTAAVALAYLAMSLPVRGWALSHWYVGLLMSHPFAGALLLLATLAHMRWRLGAAPQPVLTTAPSVPRPADGRAA
jgi:hypothetical protein